MRIEKWDGQHLCCWMLILLFVGLVGAGCSRSVKPSFVIVAVDQLSFAEANCSREWPESTSGLKILCQESVRWAHTFTTSPLSGPALGSLLTGLYPLDTGFRHNAQFLRPENLTVAEAAYQKKYRTAFFSGGPPLLRKSGLAGGFEVFDDSITLSESPWLKPFKKSVQNFFDWLDDSQDQPIFSVFYVPDLRFLNRTTINPSGDFRNKSYESQLEEFDANLFELIQKLKKIGRWDKTHFLLVGLQGRNLYDRKILNQNLNLHSESTQVAFLWKPTQTKRDSPVSWTMDRNISLPDIGHSLFELLNTPTPKSRLETGSLVVSLKKPESTIKTDRLQLIESAWPQWQLQEGISYSLILDEELYLYEKIPKLYRTLSDRFERNPLILGGGSTDTFLKFEMAAQELGLTPYLPMKKQELSIWGLHYSDWQSAQLSELKTLFAQEPPHQVPVAFRPWLARALMESGDWRKLKSVAESWKDPRLLWLAHKNLNLPDIKTDPCLKLLDSEKPSGEDLKKCSDSQFLEVLSILSDENRLKRVEKILEEKLILTSILKMNYALGGIWDVDLSPGNILSLTEIVFWTPERKSLLKNLERRLRPIDLNAAQPERL